MAMTQQRVPHDRRALAFSAIIALAAGLLAGAWWLVEPARTHLSEARSQTAALTERLETQRSRLAERPAMRSRQARLHAQVARRGGQLPTQSHHRAPLATLAAMARREDLDLERFAPSAPVTAPGQQHLPLTLVLRGSWPGLVGFLAQLTRQPRLITLEGLELERAGPEAPADDLRLTAQLSAHWRPAGPSPLTDPSRAPDQALMTPLWMTPWNTTRPAALQRNPFEDAARATRHAQRDGPRYLGRITRGEQRWALIRRADGQVQRLQPGQRIDLTLSDGTPLRIREIGADALHLAPAAGTNASMTTDFIHLPLDRHP